jgi:beta-lactam-binding protein with PASTA domain
MKLPFKFKRPVFKMPDFRALFSTAVRKVREFRLPLDLSKVENLDREHYKIVVYTLSAVIVLMVLAGVLAFAFSLKGTEQTMVPDIRGVELSQALVKLQEKELYPRIALRFTDDPNDRGRIVEQRPLPGSIVKAGRRINLVVSRGPVVDRIENYVGQDLNEVKIHLQTLFSSTRPLLSIKDPPVYIYDQAAPGIILEQKPLPDTELAGPVALELVVSRGPEKAKTTVPDLRGLDYAAAMLLVEKANLPIVTTMRKAEAKEKPGTIASESPAGGSQVSAWSLLNLVVTAPAPEQGMVSGVFAKDLPAYPYPLRVSLDVLKPSGERSTIFRVNHPGGKFSVPYFVPDGSVLILTALDREVARTEVRAP